MDVTYNYKRFIGNYGTALHHALENNSRIARQGWNGKAMFVFAAKPYTSGSHSPYVEMESCLTQEEIEEYEPLPFLVMKTADNKLVPWLCSQTDALANDWYLVEAEFTYSISDILEIPDDGVGDEEDDDYVQPIDPSEIV